MKPLLPAVVLFGALTTATAWTFGSLTGYQHKWGNYDVVNPEKKTARLGTEAYRAYMEHLKVLEPGVFVDKHERLPDAPSDLSRLAQKPELAVFTHLRNQSLRCHYAVWIELIADGRIYRQFLNPGDKPRAALRARAEEVSLRAYCNLHGLWKAE